jgi:hypothetical protein
MSYFGSVKIIDSTGAPQGVLMEDNCLTTRDYLIAIAEEEITSHKRFVKMGYTPTMTITESDIWSKAGVYAYPATGIQMQLSSDQAAGATGDTGTVIKGNAEGANQTILCDAGGDATTLIDADVDFTAATGVAVGDCVLLSPKGDSSTAALTPEWGYITDITNAATGTLIIGGGFSLGGTCAVARAYTIVDASAFSGAQVVKIGYLTSTYAERTILMCLNNTTQVTTKDSAGNNLTNLFRINSFRIIAAGSGAKATGNLWLESVIVTPRTGTVYGYITALFTRSRNAMYTVPAGKTLFINKITAGFSLAAGTKWEYARIYLRTNRDNVNDFLTGNIFYSVTEIIANNATVVLPFSIPIVVHEKTDIKMSGIASAAGVAVCSYRGWIETN